MSDGKKSLKEIFNDRNIKQIIIPEIQRDYVWKTENVEKLLKSVIDDARENIQKFSNEELESYSPKIRELAERENNNSIVYSNIGFIYTYKDNEFNNRNFLVDGQQRLTTLYLLLLATAIKTGKKDYFVMQYFKNSLPTVDYKVRESAHNFLVRFIQHLLDGGSVSDIKNQYWFFLNYIHDRTITSLIQNYATILRIVEEKELKMDYVENNIELWVFDVTNSSQGEELYIYMNSRGEEVIVNENIKALLLEDLSETEKFKWGKKWEDWQDFFWKCRGENQNADKGFNEFLRWIIVIECIKTNRDALSVEGLGKFITTLHNQEKFSSELLSIEIVAKYFELIKTLKDEEYLEEKWLTGVTSIIDYYRFFPSILYVEKYPIYKLKDLTRVLRFFRNTSRVEDISKNPETQTVNAVKMMLDFLNEDLVDIVDLIKFRETQSYQIMLSEEECYKLNIYKNQIIDRDRLVIEESFHKAEDNSLLNGEIEFILFCSDIQMGTDHDSFNLTKFDAIYSIFEQLFYSPSDEFRRSLLTMGNYAEYDGYSTYLESYRYSFGHNIETWKKIIGNRKKQIRTLITKYEEIRSTYNYSQKEVLDQIISTFLLENTNSTEWYIPFIKYPKVLEYCENKKFCYSENGENVILIKKDKATTTVDLKEFS